MSEVAYTRVQRVGLAVGILELIGAVLWCVLAASIDGSPLTIKDSNDLPKVGAFLLMGPLSVLPASILAGYRPLWSGLWLIVGGVLSWYLIMFSIPHPDLRGSLHFETLAPLLLVSMPMLVLGPWQLLAGSWARSKLNATHVAAHKSPNGGTAATPSKDADRQLRNLGADLLWITLGIIGAFCITCVAFLVADSLFDSTVRSRPLYARGDQTPVNAATGLGIMATGWLLAVWLVRRRGQRVPSGFVPGLILATTVIGIAFALN